MKPNGSNVPIWTVLILLVGLFSGALMFLYGRIVAVEAMSQATAIAVSVNTERIIAIQKNLDKIDSKLDEIIKFHTTLKGEK